MFIKQALPTTSVRPDSRASLGTASPVPSLASTSGGGGAAAAGATTIAFFYLLKETNLHEGQTYDTSLASIINWRVKYVQNNVLQ